MWEFESMEFGPIDFESWTEQDVREDLLAPLLKDLGYAKGTENDIIRGPSLSLRYRRNSLGRKKPQSDPPLRGEADYICEVAFPSGRKVRWVLEAKRPSEDLEPDAAEQAYSYANHPQVCAVYFCVSNGREIRLYQTSSGTQSPPILAVRHEELEEKLPALVGVLGPDSIRRDWKDRAVDPGLPIGPGLRSIARIVGGSIEYEAFSVGSEDFSGLTLSVVRGAVERDPEGRLLGYFCTRAPFAQIQRTIGKLGLERFEATSADSSLSTNPSAPSEFTSFQQYTFPKGEALYDIRTGTEIELPLALTVDVETLAAGHLDGRTLSGRFCLGMQYQGLEMLPVRGEGKFEVHFE